MKFLTNYSLQQYPYDLEPLNPLLVSAHAELLIRVSGATDLDRIDEALVAGAQADAPVFALVTGQEYCGLTSVANSLLARYAMHRGIDASRFVVPQGRVSSDNVHEFWVNWITQLVDQVDKRRLAVDAKLIDAIDARLNDVVPGRIAASFLRPLRRLSDELNELAPRAGFGVCIENPMKVDYVETAFQTFASSRTICVLVVGDYADGRDRVIKHFKEYDWPGPKLIVPMTPISGADVDLLVRERWTRSAGEVPAPFETKALESAFKNRARPIKRIMILMEKVLKYKALIEHPTKVWPQDQELFFNTADLTKRIELYDEEGRP